MAAVPPTVNNANAQAALDEAADSGGPMVRVSRASKRLKIADGLQATGSITEAEHGEHEAFRAKCTAAATNFVVDGGAPAWFAGALAAGLAPLTARLTDVENTVNNLTADVNNLQNTVNTRLSDVNTRLDNIESRQVNSVASDRSDPLRSLTNDAGVHHDNFPANLAALMSMTGVEMQAMLAHYSLSQSGNNDAKLNRLKKFIGMRIA